MREGIWISDEARERFNAVFVEPYKEEIELYNKSVAKWYRLQKVLNELFSIEVMGKFEPWIIDFNRIIHPPRFKEIHELVDDISIEFIESKEKELAELKEKLGI